MKGSLTIAALTLRKHEIASENPGELKPIDSKLKVKEGQLAPDFTLPAVGEGHPESVSGKEEYRPVLCPSRLDSRLFGPVAGIHNIARDMFDAHDAILLGITVDNIPALFSWTNQMGKLWFHMLPDFYPHGKTAGQYGSLRTDEVSERAIFVIDKKGIIHYLNW
jgi:peroxiredoxin (alkyl hydroperoxide reductase subunit C)